MKAYVKPQLFFESYELNQNIAACGWDLQQNSKETCKAWYDPNLDNSYPYPGVSLFTSSPRCSILESSYCYMNNTGKDDAFKVFQS